MKLSTKGRYGVRLMLDLAEHYGEGPILLKDIAERQEISEKYLWQLVPPLKQAGLLTSTRGAHGGYTLTRSPAQISLREVVTAVEGPISLVECVENASFCSRVDTCVTRDVWAEISAQILANLNAVTLQGLVEKQKSKTPTMTYVI